LLVYRRLDEAVADLAARLGGLPSPTEANAIWTTIWTQEAHHSTAIEGNTLILSQVEVLLAEGRAVGNRELREYMEVIGYADAAKWVYSQGLEPGDWTTGAALSLTEVRHTHRLALGPAWSVAPHPVAGPQEGPGSFRRHDIAPFSDGMAPPSWVEVDAALSEWLHSLDGVATAAHPIEALAAAHGAYERIHPFVDGNGRTGRLILNLLLLRLGYPPAIIYTRDRARYVRALRRADGGDPGPLGELIARCVTDNLYRFVLPAVAGPDQLVPLASLAQHQQSVGMLRAAIERGRLKAQKAPNGQWRSTRAWVDEYLATRHRRDS
jgi:hypothetical protein